MGISTIFVIEVIELVYDIVKTCIQLSQEKRQNVRERNGIMEYNQLEEAMLSFLFIFILYENNHWMKLNIYADDSGRNHQ